jgi:hypothetical protein
MIYLYCSLVFIGYRCQLFSKRKITFRKRFNLLSFFSEEGRDIYKQLMDI